MQLIVGLGNPGEKYNATRHNVGFAVIDALARELKTAPFRFEKKFNADITVAEIGGNKILLVKPRTYMNNSGVSVRALMNFYKLLPKTLAIFTAQRSDLSKTLCLIHDDIDIAFGNFKIQTDRSGGGHNGVQSVINQVKTQNFTRVRVGVASPLLRAKIAPEKFVLQPFTAQEKKELDKIIPAVVAGIVEMI